MKLTELIDPTLLQEMIDGGYISVRPHPDDPELRIYNYTAAAQYERKWNDATELCRGLIVRGDEIVGRPFRKFYNLGEVTSVPSGPFRAVEKEDGSLGIGYIAPDGEPAIATRGSFTSDQAIWATKFLREDQAKVDYVRVRQGVGVTPLFEIIYPENRIVLDYGGRKDLILLTNIWNKNGREVEGVASHNNQTDDDFWFWTEIHPQYWIWPGGTVVGHMGLTLEDLANMPSENREGFVLCWPDGTRLKYKFDEYIRLHRLITGISERSIWQLLVDHVGIEQMAEHVPDEFYQWMKDVAHKLEEQFTEIEQEAFGVLAQVDLSQSRKEQAQFILKQPHSDIVFSMLDNKPYARKIWDRIYPEAS